MIKDGLMDEFNNYHMGVTAENIAKKFNISRQEQDEFALSSQKKTKTAILENKFNDEIIKINNKGNIFDRDEHPRTQLKLSDLEKLKTVFQENGTVTPGNSSGINDGAAALLLTTLEQAEKKSIKPLVKIVSWASVGVDPTLMGLGPINAVREAIKKAKWSLDEIDLFEINEAFAAQSIAVIRELDIDQKNYKSYFNCANLYSDVNQFDKSIEFLKSAVKYAPDNSDVKHRLGEVYQYKYQQDRDRSILRLAEECFLDVIKLNDSYVNAYIMLGVTYLWLEKIQESNNMFKSAHILIHKNKDQINFNINKYLDNKKSLETFQRQG